MTVSRITMLMVAGVCGAGCLDTSFGGVQSTDVPASALSIEPTIVDTDPAPADGMIPVSVQFFHANNYVRLASASVSCNGVTLPWGSLGYTARVPIVAPGGSLVFAHTQAGVTTQFSYPVPARPVVTSPTANETVLRDSSLMIGYVAAASTGVRPIATDGAFGAGGALQSDTGMAFLDASLLRAGPGTVEVTRRFVNTPPGSAFQSAVVTYTIASLPTPVTWQ